MSDFFDDLPPVDPREALRAADAKPLPKRFYTLADYAAEEGGLQIRLDGRPVKTPAKARLLVDREGVAAAIAAEWNAQGEFVLPASMPLSRLVNSAIDGVALDQQAVRDEIVRYAGSDLLCYRADGPARLVEAEERAWNPPLDWIRQAYGARFVLAEGIVHVEQFPETLAAVDRAIGTPSVFVLAALSTVTTLTGSAILALALRDGALTVEQAWQAAHVDEDYEISLWGADTEAEQRRAGRFREMQAAALLLTA